MIEWDKDDERGFETGTDRGVLYLEDGAVPWNGLIGVQQNLVGGEAERLYYDGDLFCVLVGRESYQATVDALWTPPEFDEYDGYVNLAPGLSATRQQRSRFGFSYRTLLGDGVQGIDLGYKIHMVWNIISVPYVKNHRTVTDSPTPTSFQWVFEASVPPPGNGSYIPTAHLEANSTTSDPVKFAALEDALYGATAALPTQAEVIDILN